jgi:hypothetical protein
MARMTLTADESTYDDSVRSALIAQHNGAALALSRDLGCARVLVVVVDTSIDEERRSNVLDSWTVEASR